MHMPAINMKVKTYQMSQSSLAVQYSVKSANGLPSDPWLFAYISCI